VRAKTRSFFLILLLPFYILVKAQHPPGTDSLLAIIPKLEDSAKASALFSVANGYYLNGMNDSALYFFDQSLEQATKANLPRHICEAYLAIAKCKMHLDKQEEAIKILFSSISISEKEKLTKQTASAKYLVAIIYDYQNRYKDALRFSTESENEFVRLKDTAGLVSLYPEVVTCLGKNGDTVKALDYFKRGLEMLNEYQKSTTVSNEDKEHLPLTKMALIFNGINIMEKEKDLLVALDEVKKISLGLIEKGNEYEKFEVYTLLAVVNLKLKRNEDAQLYAGMATNFIRRESGNFEQLGDLYHIIADASASLGQYERAYKALDSFKTFHDSVFNIRSLEAIHSVEAKYETAKKEEKIVTLKKEKRNQQYMIIGAIAGLLVLMGLLAFAIRSKRLQQKLLLKEQEVQRADLERKMVELEQTALRAQMNPHFIFNCLNSVQRYVINNDVKGVNIYLSAFASLIRQTLENSGKSIISLQDELQYLDTYIKMEQMRAGDNFAFEIKVQDNIDTTQFYIPSMIIQPFVENSILHGLRGKQEGKGELRLTVSKKEKLLFVVEDNGPGINISRQPLHAGKDIHESMGSSITAKRIELYNSLHDDKIEFSIIDLADMDSSKSGTKVVVEFPTNNNDI
jgi:tetratricopeptide (TPR) repeat protein/two-component sensor histidine kinase